MTSYASSRRRLLLAIPFVLMLALASVLVPAVGLPGFSATAAHASVVTNTTTPGSGGGTGGCASNGTCSSGHYVCNSATGGGNYVLNGVSTPFFYPAFPMCKTNATPAGANVTCPTSYLVWDFYGTGNPNSSAAHVSSYTISEVIPKTPCAAQATAIFAPNPADSTTAVAGGGGSVGTNFYNTPGTSWCSASSQLSIPFNAAPRTQCIGESAATYEYFHLDPANQPTTNPPFASVQDAGVSCNSLATANGTNPISTLLSDTTSVTNPYGTGSVSVETAVKEALVGGGGVGTDSVYNQNAAAAGSDWKIAASVINDQSAADANINTHPTQGNIATYNWPSGQGCASNLQYATQTPAPVNNYGTCIIPVDALLTPFTTSFGTAYGVNAWTTTGPGNGAPSMSAGYRFADQTGSSNIGAVPAPNWRSIISSDVATEQIRSGNTGNVAGPGHSFPWNAFEQPGAPQVANAQYAQSVDYSLAAYQASQGANCYAATGPTVTTATSVTGNVKVAPGQTTTKTYTIKAQSNLLGQPAQYTQLYTSTSANTGLVLNNITRLFTGSTTTTTVKKGTTTTVKKGTTTTVKKGGSTTTVKKVTTTTKKGGSTTTTRRPAPTTTTTLPGNARLVITINPTPTYGVDGGTLNTNSFSAWSSALECPNPANGAYEACSALYPGKYTLNSLSYQMDLTSATSNYAECAVKPTTTPTNCEYFLSRNGSSLTAYFYQATQPGQDLALDVGSISGSYSTPTNTIALDNSNVSVIGQRSVVVLGTGLQ